MPRVLRLLTLTAVLVCALCSVAFADGPVGADPQSNFPVNQLPQSCNQPTSAACLDASVSFLNQARAGLGQGPYQLPADFDSLTPQIQQFVLTNLDRILYGLPPITGITAGLSQDAMGGVQNDTDPHPTDPRFNYWTANWAGGFENVVLAYEAWMYDDGPGSGNLDCTSPTASGCWGHRHDVLWSFAGTGALAMGSAVGNDPSATPGYATVIGEGDAGSYQPTYTYTWSQAVADGAGTGSGAVGSSSGSGSPSSSGSAIGAGSTPPAPQRVIVTVNVHGPGAVIDPAGHHCHNSTCSFTETPGHAMRLFAHADGRTTFAGWSGPCNGPVTTCTLTPAGTGASVSASFHPARARVSRRQAVARAARARSARSARVHVGRIWARARIRVSGQRVVVRISSPARVALRCALTPRSGGRFGQDSFHRCWTTTIYPSVPSGRYRLRVRSTAGLITAYVRAR